MSILSRNPTDDENRSRYLINTLIISNINKRDNLTREFIISSLDVKEWYPKRFNSVSFYIFFLLLLRFKVVINLHWSRDKSVGHLSLNTECGRQDHQGHQVLNGAKFESFLANVPKVMIS